MSDIKKRVIKGGAGFFLSNLLTRGLGIFFIVISGRMLGPSEFGVLSLGLSVLGVVTNIGKLGLPNTIQRYLSGAGEDRAEQIFGGILLITVFTGLFFSVMLFVSSNFIATSIFDEPKLKVVLEVLSVGVAFRIYYNNFNAILQAQEKIKQFIISTVSKSVLRVCYLVVGFIWIQNAVMAALAGIIATLTSLLYVVKCVSNLRFKLRAPQKRDAKKVISYSMPLVLVGFSYFLMQQTDRLMLGWLSTSSNVGIYTAISTLALVMSVFHGSLVSIFLPIASEAYRNRKLNRLGNTYLFISKWVGGINGLLVLLFAGTGIWILGIFGADYVNMLSYEVLLILSFLYFFGTWLGPTGALLQMSDGHLVEFYNTLVFLVLNIVLNYFLILSFGLLGAAWATLISGLVRNLIQAIEIKYLLGISVIDKQNLGFLAITILGVWLCYSYQTYSLLLFLLFLIVSIAYKMVSVNEEEKEMIQLLFNKIKSKL